MAGFAITAEQTVAEALRRSPESARAFFDLGMACVGCPMAPFVTLAEAAAAYRLEVERLLEAMRNTRAAG